MKHTKKQVQWWRLLWFSSTWCGVRASGLPYLTGLHLCPPSSSLGLFTVSWTPPALGSGELAANSKKSFIFKVVEYKLLVKCARLWNGWHPGVLASARVWPQDIQIAHIRLEQTAVREEGAARWSSGGGQFWTGRGHQQRSATNQGEQEEYEPKQLHCRTTQRRRRPGRLVNNDNNNKKNISLHIFLTTRETEHVAVVGLLILLSFLF